MPGGEQKREVVPTPTVRDRVLGCLLAGAVGDALGAPIEFASWEEIERRYGPDGVTGFLPAFGRGGGAITDDTQMTLFTAEGLIRSHVRRAERGVCHPPSVVLRAYLRWFTTQGEAWPGWIERIDGPDGWLIQEPVLHARRAPGTTCLSALRNGPRGSIEEPVNDSKGCGGIMRAAPAGLVRSGDAFRLGAECAALTHGHPSGYLPAGVLADTIDQLLTGASLDEALDHATAKLSEYRGHEETLRALEAGRELAARGRPRPRDLESLGGGWTGEEALAIAVASALTATGLLDGLLLAVNHSGDSDSTGAIAGNLLGAVHGVGAIPGHLLSSLEAADVIGRIGGDLVEVFHGDDTGDVGRWGADYPGH